MARGAAVGRTVQVRGRWGDVGFAAIAVERGVLVRGVAVGSRPRGQHWPWSSRCGAAAATQRECRSRLRASALSFRSCHSSTVGPSGPRSAELLTQLATHGDQASSLCGSSNTRRRWRRSVSAHRKQCKAFTSMRSRRGMRRQCAATSRRGCRSCPRSAGSSPRRSTRRYGSSATRTIRTTSRKVRHSTRAPARGACCRICISCI